MTNEVGIWYRSETIEISVETEEKSVYYTINKDDEEDMKVLRAFSFLLVDNVGCDTLIRFFIDKKYMKYQVENMRNRR